MQIQHKWDEMCDAYVTDDWTSLQRLPQMCGSYSTKDRRRSSPNVRIWVTPFSLRSRTLASLLFYSESSRDTMPERRAKKLPRDVNQLAKAIVDQATSEAAPAPQAAEDGKNPAAVALGRLGGLKGGKARAAKLTAKQRKESAKKAARRRWQGKDDR